MSTTPTTAPGPGKRVARTALQVVIAVAAAVPAAVALLPLSAEDVAWPIGIAGCTVIIVTAVQNGLDDLRNRG